jgi:hypothetical protein
LNVEQCSIRNDPDDFDNPATCNPPVPLVGAPLKTKISPLLRVHFLICYGADQFIS